MDSAEGPGYERNAPPKVGEEVAAGFHSPAVPQPEQPTSRLVWQQTLHFAGATYIAPHFAHFSVPEGAYVVVKDNAGLRTHTYQGNGKEVPGQTGFWGVYMPGERAIVELYSSVAVPAGAVIVDRFARGLEGFRDAFPSANTGYDEVPDDMYSAVPDDMYGSKSICGADDSDWAKCFANTEAVAYDKARAVVRLLTNGVSPCTGWLIGSEGHMITNQHCIGSAADAANTTYEFMAEGASCTTNCATFGGCPGIVEAETGELIQSDIGNDYALVKLPGNLSETYGYYQLRGEGPILGERIYIPQHPAGWGKRFAFKAGASDAVISSVDEFSCTGGGNDVGYFADTQGGSSGSPVIGYDDHLVVALHHCAPCPNRGVPIDNVIADLGTNLPADAVFDGCEIVADAGPDQTICRGESTTLGSPGTPGTQYRWTPGGANTAQITVAPTETTTYTLTATNACGSATDTVTVTIVDGTSHGFAEDFASDAVGWTTSGLWHHSENSTCATPGHASPPGAMYYGQDASCDYDAGQVTAGALISPLIPGITAESVLRFQYLRQVESFDGAYDQTAVLVSADDGVTWTEVWYRDSATVSAGTWQGSEDISLAAFAGNSIRLSFQFDSVDAASNQFVGWFIDDVVVTTGATCTDNTAPDVTINLPGDGAIFAANKRIRFFGAATDAEDGTITANLSWTSDIDGVIGTGMLFSRLLSPGSHTITATVADSDGAESATSIAIEVLPGASALAASE